MSKEAPKRRPAPKKLGTLSAEEQLRAAREIVRREAAGVWKVSYRLNSSFCEAIKLLYTCKGSAIITGMGKAGLIGQKIAATLSSTGTPAHFLHPAEAFHGDLGRVHAARRRRDAHAKRRNGRSDAAVAVAPRIRRAADRDHGGSHEHASAGRPTSSSSSAIWKKSARSASRRARAPRPCWPSATRSRS